MSCNGNCECAGQWKVSDILAFYNLPDTNTQCTVTGNNDDVLEYDIRDYEFLGSCKVIAKAEDAYNFMKKDKSGVLKCQSIFTDWNNGEFFVTFYMKDITD